MFCMAQQAVFSSEVCFLFACEPETTKTYLNNILMFCSASDLQQIQPNIWSFPWWRNLNDYCIEDSVQIIEKKEAEKEGGVDLGNLFHLSPFKALWLQSHNQLSTEGWGPPKFSCSEDIGLQDCVFE